MGAGEFLNINFFTALFTLINTVVLFLVLKKKLFKPVMKMIQDRQQEIDDLYASAEEAKSQAQELRDAYESKLEDASQAGEQIIKEATARGQERQKDILLQATTEAEAIRRKAEADVAREKKKAVNEAKDEIAGLAMDIAEKIVGRNLNDQDQSALVDRFIDQLGEGV